MPRNLKFTFAVIADTHVNQHEDHSSSVYRSSRLANARARHVIEELNRLSPAFVIHLDDLVMNRSGATSSTTVTPATMSTPS